MPVTAPLLSSAIQAQLLLRKLTGRDAINIAGAIGSAVSRYLVTPNLVTCTLNGTVGPLGNINSVAVAGLVPNTMSSFMLSKAFIKKFKGRDMSKLFDAISMGLIQVLIGMVLSGSAVGVALGVGTGRFTSVNEQILSKLMYAEMLRKKMRGRDALSLCDCVSSGIVKHLQTSVTFTVIVSGVIAPTPPVGPVAIVGVPSVYTQVS